MQFVAGTLTGRAWTWTVLQDFSPATTCTWTPTAAGAYRLLVWARDGATAVKELYDTQTVVIRHPGETPSTKVTVAPFKGNRAAAVSYTFDDGTKNQYVYGVPIFDQHGLRATFNIVGHYTPDTAGNYDSVSWAEWRTALARGHEVGNHSLDHLNMSTLTAAQATVQVEENARLIAEKLGVTPVSFALPHTAGNSRVYEIIHRTHVALRGDYVNYGGADFTAAQANAMVNSAVANRRWLVPILHGVADTTYLPISREVLSAHLAYAKGCDAWIDTFGVISRYVLERDTAQLAVAEDAPGRCTFTLGTPLDLAIYNVPLTVRIGPLAAQPANVQAYRSGDATLLPATVTDTAGAWSIQLDVTPGPIPVTVLWDTAP
jgi:peptidoglycan/xylan/chitin deacetylase (PgdA/CDA1 family)